MLKVDQWSMGPCQSQYVWRKAIEERGRHGWKAQKRGLSIGVGEDLGAFQERRDQGPA